MSASLGTTTAVTRADNTQFDAAMRASGEVVVKTTTQVMTASEKAAAARERQAARLVRAAKLESDAEAFAARFTGNAVDEKALRVINATKAEKAASSDYRKAQELAKTSYRGEAESANLLAVNLQRLTAARAELTLATAALTKVETVGHVVSDRQAASAVVRGIESGNVGIRAVENTLVKFGAGPALQAAFSVVGPVALALAVGKAGEELYDLGVKGKRAGEELAHAFTEFNGHLATSNDELALTNARLEDEIGKLSKHPTNGVRTALAEARVEADKLQDSLAGDLKQLNALLKEQEVGKFEGLISGVASTAGVTKEVTKIGRDYEREAATEKRNFDAAMMTTGANQAERERQTKAHYDRMDQIGATYEGKLRGRAAQVAQKQKDSNDIAASVNRTGAGSGGFFIPIKPLDYSDKVDAFNDAADTIGRIRDRGRLTQTNVSDAGRKAALESSKQMGEEGKKAAELQLKAMEAHVAEWKTLAPVSEKAIYGYWDVQRNAFAVGSQQYNSIVEKQAQLAEEGARKATERIKRYTEEQKRFGEEASSLPSNPMGAWNRDAAKAQAERYDASNEAAAQLTANRGRMEEVQISEAAGRSMTQQAAATAMAAVHTREYGAELDRLIAKRKAVAETPLDAGHEAERQRELDGLDRQIAQTRANRTVQVLQDQYSISPPNTSLLVGATSALEDFVKATTDAGSNVRNVFSSALSSTNEGIVHALTTRHKNGEHVFGNIGAGIFRNVAGAGLNAAEGGVLKAFGFGGGKKPTGAAGDPLHVIMAGSTASSAVTSGLSSLGGKAMGLLGKIGGFASHFLPGFADGVDSFSGGYAMVGERGPEIVSLPRGASVTPNHKIGTMFGGGSTPMQIHVDARGSADPAQVEAAAHRAVLRAAPHIIAASNARYDDNKRRSIGK